MMNVSFNQNLRTGIDATVLNEVSNQILKRAYEKTARKTQSYTKASSDLGIDLYKVDAQTSRQVTLNNTSFQITLNENTLKSLRYLNSQAAQNVQKQVEGKITFSVNEGTTVQSNNELTNLNTIISLATAKDKQGSNPFYHGEFLANNNKNSEENKMLN